MIGCDCPGCRFKRQAAPWAAIALLAIALGCVFIWADRLEGDMPQPVRSAPQ